MPARQALNDPAVRGDATQTIRSLIRSSRTGVVDGAVVTEIDASAGALTDFA